MISRVPIVCALDDAYVSGLCTLMRSIAGTNEHADLKMIVLHRNLSEAGKRRIQSNAQQIGLTTELRSVPYREEDFPVTEWFSDAIYLRFAIVDIVKDHPVVLYLDADTLVLRDLRPLLETSVEDVPLAAVRDAQYPVIGRGLAIPGWRELGLPAGRDNFNSGVMLLNLEECRRREIFPKSRYFLREYWRHARYWDQDALNWAVDDDWLRLDRTWNTLPLSVLSAENGFHHFAEDVIPLAVLLADEEDAAIMHFAGSAKPWHTDYPESRPRKRYLSFTDPVQDRASGK